MRRFTVPTVMTAVALAAGCAASGGYSATAANEGPGPDLVYAAPGVQVIADYDEPIFYADSYYWRFDGVTWYRSSYYTGGWAYAAAPVAVLQIDRPREFVHYRPMGWVERRAGAQVREDREVPARVEPRPLQAAAPPPPAAPAPLQAAAPPPAAAALPQAVPAAPHKASARPNKARPARRDRHADSARRE